MQSSSATASNATNPQEQHLREQLELLKHSDGLSAEDIRARDQKTASNNNNDNNGASGGIGDSQVNTDVNTTTNGNSNSNSPPLLSNGFDHMQATSQDAIRALNNSNNNNNNNGVAATDKTGPDAFIHPDLRAAPQPTRPANMMQMGLPHPAAMPPTTALAPAPPAPPPVEDPMVMADGRMRAKRELSQSKRAAQNRAAQRAFRQRKETYIKQLEQQVKDFRDMETSYRTTQAENYALREYIITLQAKLLESHGEFPPAPANVNLSHQPPAPEPQMAAAPEPPMETEDTHMTQPDTDTHMTTHETETEPSSEHGMTSGTPLEAVAQAVAGLAAQEHLVEGARFPSPPPPVKTEEGNHTDATQPADETNRHTQPTEGATEQPDTL